jgi:hypothetical protein
MTQDRTDKPKRAYGQGLMTPIPVRFPPAMVEAINAIRAERMDAPDKGQVIRELVAEALAARGKRKRER